MKERQSNFELLRLLAIYMIVLIHINMYVYNFSSGAVALVYSNLINGICNTGVTLFILISGYFGVKLDVKKLTKLELRMIIYSLIVLAIMFAIGYESYSFGDKLELAAKALLPFISRNHWFYTCYVLIILFSGFINEFVNNLGEKKLRHLLILMLVVFSIFPTFLYFEVVPDNGKGIVQMLMVYMMGRYIRLYGEDFGEKNAKWFTPVFICLWIINAVSHAFPIQLGGIYHTLCKDNSITNLIIAVCVFYLFKKMSFRSKLINTCAKYVFAIFAINYVLIDICVDAAMGKEGFIPANSFLGILLLVAISLAIVIICIIIGIIRELLLAKVDEAIAGKLSSVIDAKIEKIS